MSSYNYVIEGLTTGTGYQVRVSCYSNENGLGMSRIANTVTVPRTTPDFPTNVAAETLSQSAIKFTFLYPTDGGAVVDQYQIEWSTYSNFADVSLTGNSFVFVPPTADRIIGTPFFYNIRGLSANTLYYVRVKAHNDRGWSAYTSPVSATTAYRTPGTPQNVRLTALSGVQIRVEWDAPSDELLVFGGDGGRSITKYLVEWDTPDFSIVGAPAAGSFLIDSGSAREFIIGTRDSFTGYETTTLARDTVYAVRVAAWNAEGYGDYGFAVPHTVTTADTVPDAPLDFTLEADNFGHLPSSWTLPDVDGGDTFETAVVQLSRTSAFGSIDQQVVLPFIHEVQTVSVLGSPVQEVQQVDVVTAVTNEVQTLTTSVTGIDEVQIVSITSDPVEPHVETVTTYAADVDEIQTVTVTGIDVNEVQDIVTSTADALTQQHEVATVRITSTDIDEVQYVELFDDYSGVAAYTEVTVSDASGLLVAAPAGLDGQLVRVNCGENPSDEVVFELDSDSSASGVVVGAHVIDISGGGDVDAIADTVASSVFSWYNTNAPGVLASPSSASAGVVRLICADEQLAGAVSDNVQSLGVFTSIGSTSRGNTDIELGSAVTFTVGADLSQCSLCTVCSGSNCYMSATPNSFHAGMTGPQFQAALEAIPALNGQVTVSREDDDSNPNHRLWYITFSGSGVNGDLASAQKSYTNSIHVVQTELTGVDGVSGGTTIDWGTVADGNQINGGKFYLTYTDFDSGVTEDMAHTGIDFDSSDLVFGLRLQAIHAINELDVTRSLPDAAGGYTWTITFSNNDGDLLPLLATDYTDARALVTSRGEPVTIEVCHDSSACYNGEFIDPTSTWAITIAGYSTTSPELLADASAADVEAYINSFTHDVTGDALPPVYVQSRTREPIYQASVSNGWTGGYRWRVVFSSAPGDVAELIVDTSNLVQTAVQDGDSPIAALADVTTVEEGNSLSGWFKLSYDGEVTPAITLVSATGTFSAIVDADATAAAIEAALEALPNVDDVTVTTSSSVHGVAPYTPNDVGGFTWEVTFVDAVNGGNVPQLQVAMTCDGSSNPSGSGSSWCEQVVSSSSSPSATATVSLSTLRDGNQLDGTFKLQFHGKITGELPFDISASALEAALELLDVTDDITVTRETSPSGTLTAENQVQSYIWHITFSSDAHKGDDYDEDWDTGYSQAWGRNVGSDTNSWVTCVGSDLEETTDGMNSRSCAIAVEDPGVAPVNGYFRLALDTTGVCGTDGYPYACDDVITRDIRHDAPATRADAMAAGRDVSTSMEAILEELSVVGDVDVTRTRTDSTFAGGYTWYITFLRDGAGDWCMETSPPSCPSPGDVPEVTIEPANSADVLTATNSPAFDTSVVESVRGNVLGGSFVVASTSLTPTSALPFNAESSDVQAALEALPEFITVIVSRERTSKYRTYQWTITYTANTGMTPLGSGDISPLAIDASSMIESAAGVCSACATDSLDVVNAEVQAGSESLGGFWSINMPTSAEGHRLVPFDCSARRLELELEGLNNIVNVHVHRDDTFGAGWEGEYVQPLGALGGFRYTIYFTSNAGTVGSFTFPPGSGDRTGLETLYADVASGAVLTGTDARADASTIQDGATPLGGSFSVAVDGVSTDLRDFDVTGTDLASSLSLLTSTGLVTVERTSNLGNYIGEVFVTNGVSDATVSVDMRASLAAGETIRIGGLAGAFISADGVTDLGTVSVATGDDVVELHTVSRGNLYDGQPVHIAGDTYTIASTEAAVQSISVISPDTDISTDVGSYKLVYNAPAGGQLATACIAMTATAADIQSALETVFGVGNVDVASSVTAGSAGVGYVHTVTFSGVNDAARIANADTSGDAGILVVDAANSLVASSVCSDALATNAVVTVDTLAEGVVDGIRLSASYTGPIQAHVYAWPCRRSRLLRSKLRFRTTWVLTQSSLAARSLAMLSSPSTLLKALVTLRSFLKPWVV
jgi:metal-sulfur cluster biosynthetic enzyme